MEVIEELSKLLQEEIASRREEYGFSLYPNVKINDVDHYKIMEFFPVNSGWDNFVADLQSKDITTTTLYTISRSDTPSTNAIAS